MCALFMYYFVIYYGPVYKALLNHTHTRLYPKLQYLKDPWTGIPQAKLAIQIGKHPKRTSW